MTMLFRFSWISNLGGLIGLCIGGSFISIVEILWCIANVSISYMKKIN